MKKPVLSALCLAVGLSNIAFAANEHIKIAGSIPGSVVIQPTNSHGVALMAATPVVKKIQFQRVVLSPAAQQYLADNIGKAPARKLMMASNELPPQVALDMNSVPVLDQGEHGTCATFATTAAMDAALGHTDYISQLCNLELGAYLEKKDSQYPSGWDGSTNEIVLNQVQKYGVITQDYQKQYGCANVREYPSAASNKGRVMKDTDFLKHSQKIMDNMSWKTWLDLPDALSPRSNMDAVLTHVKEALSNGHRVIFSTLIDENGGVNGVGGSYKAFNDSWVLTGTIAKDAKAKNIEAGHALVITGYDDNGVITDKDNVEHKGVLKIRNSWGAETGDRGDYYVSYDYFMALALEVKELVPTKG